MTLTVQVPLSENTYKRAKQWAEYRQRELGEAIADYLAETLPTLNSGYIPPADIDPDVEREKAAYIRLFPQLHKQYYGHYVAVHQGQLVDHDIDYGTLVERIEERYPDVFVWLTQVEDEPIGTMTIRSPYFFED
ncbi:MAG: hypothetical protein KJ063_23145 [Anaerolineae bacterium]|nr:hypothetical protein [Anaerolineae bacterium]